MKKKDNKICATCKNNNSNIVCATCDKFPKLHSYRVCSRDGGVKTIRAESATEEIIEGRHTVFFTVGDRKVARFYDVIWWAENI